MLKGLANHLAYSSPSISSGQATRVTSIPFFVQPIIDHGEQVTLAFILTALAVSPWSLLIQTL